MIPTPRPLPGQTRSTELQTHLCCGSLLHAGGTDSSRLIPPDNEGEDSHQYGHDEPEKIEVEKHFGEPRSHYCGENFSLRTASPFVVECRGTPCRVHTSGESLSKRKYNATHCTALQRFAAQFSARFARPSGRQKPLSILRSRSAVRSGLRPISYRASTRRQIERCSQSSTQSSNAD